MEDWAQLENPIDSELLDKLLHSDEGLYLFFRKLSMKAQRRFTELVDVTSFPKVFLHGNPHLENLICVDRLTGMIDFDRSRVGPYAWDIVRFLGSMAFRLKSPKLDEFLTKTIRNALFEGYRLAFDSRETDHYRIPSLLALEEESWGMDVDAYMKKGQKWAKKLKEQSISLHDEKANDLLNQYFQSRYLNGSSLYTISHIAKAKGSLGHEHYIYYLKSKDSSVSSCLIDIKQTYLDPDNEHFFSPFHHRGIQMIEACKLYAPGMEQGLGICQWMGEPYWGHVITIHKKKFSGNLSKEKMVEVAIGVGNQLGKAHRKSCYFSDPSYLLKHFEIHYPLLINIAEQLNSEIAQGYDRWKARYSSS